ncbi:NAD(P)-binding domain-containing protein [Nocardioides anomalus]|uniref:NAD(P)-binding domain-containing protein n=1 Tax=Nocardioides anomalus TaxID=2712223 RepID=A0A6G6WAX6_9ACTN|nr:NAD(P)-binding domain-containing protein [Nocardioides anomalus]QIG42303.1 NAD(P)-binding domain-containing protein [Nocardioides anomalus]
MSTITIIGAGNMATAIGGRAARAGHTVEVVARDRAKAEAAAEQIGGDVTVGTYAEPPRGDLVFLAVLHAGAAEVVRAYGDALAGKVVVETTNPFDADGTGVVTTPGHSVTQALAEAVPEDTQVLKAFNTVFRDVLAETPGLDVLFAGGDEEGRARFAEFLRSVDLRPRDAGGLEATHALEWAAIVLMGLARHGAGWDVALSAGGARVRS